MKENDFKLAKERTKRQPAHIIKDMDYADDIALLANTPTQVEVQLHSLERAGGGIGLHIHADKIEYTCFNQKHNISTLNGSPLKLVDKFTSNSLSTDIDMNTRLAKAWTAIDHMEVRPNL